MRLRVARGPTPRMARRNTPGYPLVRHSAVESRVVLENVRTEEKKEEAETALRKEVDATRETDRVFAHYRGIVDGYRYMTAGTLESSAHTTSSTRTPCSVIDTSW